MKKIKNNKGFTLIELMVAMVVLAFGILGFMFLQTRSIEGRVFSREMNRCITLAQERMDRLMAADYDDPMLAAGTHPTVAEDTDGVNDGQLTMRFQNFIYHIVWTITDNVPQNDCKKITITYSSFLKNVDHPHDPKDVANFPNPLESVKRK